MFQFITNAFTKSFNSETSWRKVALALAAPIVCVYAFDKILNVFLEPYYLRLKKERGIDTLKINKLLTFGISSKSCEGHRFKEFDCKNLDCNYGRLCYMLNFINNAKTSVDVCIYIITAQVFGDAIINAYNRGIKVRVVADSDMSFSAQSIINDFRLKEIPTRQRMSPFIMHHKFVIVDDEILINGSMNFTMTGAFCNWENVMITSLPCIVTKFSIAFDDLWDDFAPGNAFSIEAQEQHRKKTKYQNL